MTVIAKIELVPEVLGWHDPITNIHLDNKNKCANITSEMNLINIKRGIKANLIRTCEGVIEPDIEIYFNPNAHYTKSETEAIVSANNNFGAY